MNSSINLISKSLSRDSSGNSKGSGWTFGLNGIVLRMSDGHWPNFLVPDDPGPSLFTVDGGEQRAATPLFPIINVHDVVALVAQAYGARPVQAASPYARASFKRMLTKS